MVPTTISKQDINIALLNSLPFINAVFALVFAYVFEWEGEDVVILVKAFIDSRRIGFADAVSADNNDSAILFFEDDGVEKRQENFFFECFGGGSGGVYFVEAVLEDAPVGFDFDGWRFLDGDDVHVGVRDELVYFKEYLWEEITLQ